jgi:hypothetical protein
MAKHGICGIIGGGSAEGGAVERPLGFQFHIAKSREDGMSEA